MQKSHQPGVVRFPLTQDDANEQAQGANRPEPIGTTPKPKQPPYVRPPLEEAERVDLGGTGERQRRDDDLVQFTATEKVESSERGEEKIQKLIDAFGPPMHRTERDLPSRLN